ncbi:phosphoglycerate mutase-like protein [Collybia nuda]|uniref:Phosphoglycerate mutase-like protein n=1 Tax=Collybia nuda TaxID=64659 RepID=A0A9P6CGI5_9AGAR|nr:phosphoglycerate mutase-like protein [Collybia nuda]
MGNLTYDTVSGCFVQDDGLATGVPAIPPRFGLIDDSPERWTRFVAHIDQLKNTSDSNTKHKVIFFGRHGEGFHNVAIDKYQHQAWIHYWAKLDGDGEIVWGPDPELTAIGVGQAISAHEAWKAELPFGIPHPEKFYTSPLTRAMKTCEITFDGILPDDKRRAIVIENCREHNGAYTCDKRRTKSYIQQMFPLFDVEPDFSEEDTLWDENVREAKKHLTERARKVLDYIFENDEETFISITAHIGIIRSFWECLGRSPYELPTGGKNVVFERRFRPYPRFRCFACHHQGCSHSITN